MKLCYLIGIFSLLILAGCKKEIAPPRETYLNAVKERLKDSVSIADYKALAFEHCELTTVDSIGLYLLRVPFKNLSPATDFVLLKTTESGQLLSGKIINLLGAGKEFGDGNPRRRSWQGSIIISSLDRSDVRQSTVVNGFITDFHKGDLLRTSSMADPGMMPEVVVVAYIQTDRVTLSDWANLQSMLGGGGSSINYYSSLSGATSGGSGATGSAGGSSSPGYLGTNKPSFGGVTVTNPISVDREEYVNNPEINIFQYLKCFENIPDAGATCSIEIFTDIPVDGDPTKLFNWNSESPGHTFLQLKKSNGDLHALQNIGFYPESNWKDVLNSNPVDGKFVDDGGHELNASMKMVLTPYQLKGIIDKIKAIAPGLKYDMDEYNCTDFALDMFNYVRTPLEIPRYAIPGGSGIVGARTPQGLYVKLKQMKENNDPEASKIDIGFQKGWVTTSGGPCN